MLERLSLKPLDCKYEGYVPPRVRPLLVAARKGEDLVPVVDAVTASFGFNAFNCSVSLCLKPGCENQQFVFTTMPFEWVALYDQRSYVEIDPRVQTLLRSPLPIIWDQDTFRGQSALVDEFLTTGVMYGLGSGFAVGFVDLKGRPVMIALNSKALRISQARKAELFGVMGEIILFGQFFYEIFIAGIVEQRIGPRSLGAPLSPREHECVLLAANGNTGDAIGAKLGISTRTVQFHFDSIRSKLGANSRQEAVAKAVQAGIVSAAT